MILITMIFFTSCMVTKYTHTEVMNGKLKDKSKDGLINSFGIPDKKKVEGNLEEWIWYYGQEKHPADIATLLMGNDIGGSYNTTDKYLKITFQDDTFLKWETQGLDYSEKETSLVGTFMGIIVVMISLIALYSH